MHEAEVGDDVFGEDRLATELQERVADLLGKEAALFVPSGTMGNQIGIKLSTQPGDEVLVERTAHVLCYESGAAGLISGVQLTPLDGARGVLSANQVEAAVRGAYYWEPPTRLLCLENTLNKAGGVVYPKPRLDALCTAARSKNLRLHLDGARLWNASAASGIDVAGYAERFDTVNVCLSKGLGAPVGSILAGSQGDITRAHRYRKMLGGGMRQIGSLAAAALYALDHHRDRLAEDHAHARRLAEALADLPRVRIDLERVQTNIVIFDVNGADGEPADALAELAHLATHGVSMIPFGPSTIRATFHLDVSSGDLDHVIAACRAVFS